jgi:hypothetical protein
MERNGGKFTMENLMTQYVNHRIRQRWEKLTRQGMRFIALGFAPDALTIISVQGTNPANDYVWPTAWLKEDQQHGC